MCNTVAISVQWSDTKINGSHIRSGSGQRITISADFCRKSPNLNPITLIFSSNLSQILQASSFFLSFDATSLNNMIVFLLYDLIIEKLECRFVLLFDSKLIFLYITMYLLCGYIFRVIYNS